MLMAGSRANYITSAEVRPPQLAASFISRVAEKQRPQQQGGWALSWGRSFQPPERGYKRPTVNQITATRLIVPN
jgi:hypothetical protein